MAQLLLSVRLARNSDATSLSRVFDLAWREAYRGILPGAVLERMISRRGPAWWSHMIKRGRPLAVLDDGEHLAGYISYGPARQTGLSIKGEIDELYLAPEYQGCGLGRRLMKAACNDLNAHMLSPVGVWSLADNERACAFYEKHGGHPVRSVKDMFEGKSLIKVLYVL